MLGTILLVVIIALFLLIILAKGLRTVPQANVGVVTRFGKYHRILTPGLHVLNPFTNKVAVIIPVQNRTAQLQFSAITEDQAAVHFTATIIYTVAGADEETIMQVAFKFVNDESFTTALNSAVEASVREFVAGKKQAEVLGLRQAIVDHAKSTLDEQLASWGYLLVDLTVNDIAFDPEVMKSMSRVVSAKNAQTAAEYEGQALLIAKTKQAEAEGKALVIAATNGAEAARLRGEGIAAQRTAIAEGLSESGQKLAQAGIDVSILGFSMWTETLREVAMNGQGNTIFLDGGINTMEEAMRRTNAFLSNSHPTPVQKAHADNDSGSSNSRSGGNPRKESSAQAESGPEKADAKVAEALNAGSETVLKQVNELHEKADTILDSAEQVKQEATETMSRVTGLVGAKNPPSGWYPDPSGSPFQRFWDGSAWTDKTR